MAVLVVVALVAGIGGTLFLTRQQAQASEVLLEGKASPGPNPFTDPVSETSPTPEAVASTPPAATATPAVTPSRAPAATPTVAVSLPPPPPGGNISGANSLAIYGGSGSNSVCDKTKLMAYLTANPSKAAAWAQVEGIQVAAIPTFIAPLTPSILRVDARVTNHGYVNGKATPRQSILQAGTAVLVNSEGVPVARCLCGNPLLPPVPTKTAPKYTGPAWPAFRPSAAVSILPPGALALATPTAAASQATGGPDPLLPGNLLLDGGFEQGLVAPWGTGVYEPRPTIFWGAADADGTVVTDVVHAGKKAFKIVNRTAKKPAIYKTFSQRVTLTKGAPYCLSWWGREDNAAAGLLSLTWEKTFAGRLTMPAGSTTGWGQWAASFNAEDAAVDIRVLSENTGTAWIDEIYLTPGKCVVPNGPVPTLMTAR